MNNTTPGVGSEMNSGRDHMTPEPGKKGMSKAFKIFLVITSVILIVAASLIIPMFNKGASTDALICVPYGADENVVKDSIRKYLGNDFAEDTRQALEVTLRADTLRHGAFLIEKGMSPFSAARRIATGGQAGIRVTFLGERTKEELAAKVAAKLDISAEDMVAAMNDRQLLKRYHTDPDHIIALFLDDTYEFFWNATPEKVIETMYKNYRAFWNRDNRYDKAERLRLSPRDVAALASIVDEETSHNDEKGRIGRLYINRLDKKMKLQADPTVKFAVGDFTIKRITNDMLQTESPYNTYKVEGMPPGPIRTTSGATIDAILNSAPSEDLYMCAREDFSGYHNFAADYATHLRNAERYQAELNRRGIK